MAAEIQDPRTGQWLPFTPENDNGRGNIRIDGTVYAHDAGVQAIQQGGAGAPPVDSGGGTQTAPDQPPPDQPPPDQTPPAAQAPPPDQPTGGGGGGGGGGGAPAGGGGGVRTPEGTLIVQQTGPNSFLDDKGQVWSNGPLGPVKGTGGAAPGAAPSAPSAPPEQAPGMLDPWINHPMPAPIPPGAPGAYTPPPAPVFTPPTYNAPAPFVPPVIQAPAPFVPPPAFSYADFQAPAAFKGPTFNAPAAFQAPVGDEVYQDPGYQFRAEQGRKQLETSAAAKGLIGTGGTLKDIVNYGQDLASQEYGNVYNRRAQEYDRSYTNAVNQFNQQYSQAAGEYDRDYGNLFNQWKTGYDTSANTYAANYGVAKDTFGLNATEQQAIYDRNYKGASDAWQMNATAGLNAYDRTYQGAVAAYTPQLHEWDVKATQGQQQANTAWDQQWKEYLQKYQEFQRNQEWPYKVLSSERNTGTNTI